jgi:uncharacterized protein
VEKPMKRLLVALILLAAAVPPALAGWEEGLAAYDRKEYRVAYAEFMALAQQGVPAAQNILGVMAEAGQGMPVDYAQARTWYIQAANQGLAAAQNNLGLMYLHGRGVPQDYALAVDWFRKAAEQGLPEAQHNLGVMYETGRGVPQDFARAHMWYNLAAAQGYTDAVLQRNQLTQKMSPEQIAEAQRLAREWQAPPRP